MTAYKQILPCTIAAAGFILAPMVALADQPRLKSENRQELPQANAVSAQNDDQPLGSDLGAVVFLGLEDKVVPSAGTDVDATRVPLLNTPEFINTVSAYIGKPISLKLIAEIEASVAKYYREEGYPFVAVSTPPQEITGGDLRIRVVEFQAGKVTITGNKRVTEDHINSRIRLSSGDRIASDTLQEDIDWLNRSPFRSVGAEFAPGLTPGETDLTLSVSETRPWNVYTGYTNSGSNDSSDGNSASQHRIYAGVTLGDIAVPGSITVVQVTGSPDFWVSNDGLFKDTQDADYADIAVQSIVPMGARSQLELSVNGTRTNGTTTNFLVQEHSIRASAGVRTALSNFGSGVGDLTVGIETSYQKNEVFFANIPLGATQVSVYQGFIGWDWSTNVQKSRLSVSANAHLSPGNIGQYNTDAAFTQATAGRVTDATYAYVDLNVQASHDVGLGMQFYNGFSGQISTGALPETQQVSIGGESAVRAYSSNNGNFDWLALLQNELRFKPINIANPALGPVNIRLAPYLFGDLAVATNYQAANSQSAISAGAGVRAYVNEHITANAAVGRAFLDAPSTKAGDWDALLSFSAKY